MSKLSDRVYNILMDNAKQPTYRRATVDIKGGQMDTYFKSPEDYGFDIGVSVDSLVQPSRLKRINKNKKIPQITEYDMEEFAEPIDYMENENNGGCCCPTCGGSMYSNRYNKTYKNKPKKGGAKGNEKGKEALMYYNKCLKHLKDNKGMSHKEAQQVLKQMKEEFSEELEGGSWKHFWHGFKKGFTGTLKTAANLAPLML